MNTLGIGAALAATAALVAGLKELLGAPGVGIAALITVFLANPISSVTQPKEFLPGSWGAIGQYFVPGAGGTLIRNLSYFPDASNGFYWIVLTGWLLLGILLFGVAKLRDMGRVKTQ